MRENSYLGKDLLASREDICITDFIISKPWRLMRKMY